jgi:Ser/Thr protein kinase RdoA (MazF antagonist)
MSQPPPLTPPSPADDIDPSLPLARVSHSVLHPAFIAEQVAQRYDLPEVTGAFLLYRGINDVYLVRAGAQKYALRVWRKTWRSPDDVDTELQFLEFLRQRRFGASTGIRARDGKLYFKAQSPEGPRALALYTWAPGRKFGDCLDEATAARIGAAFAQMHRLGLEYARGRAFDTRGISGFGVTVPALLEFVYDRPDDLRDYAVLAQRLPEALLALQGEDVPMGICHRDFHPSNVHVADDGGITLLDFDGTGDDYLMQDVQNYVWGNLFYGFSPAYGEAFERGYETVRPFTAAERRHRELFLLAKAFRLVSGMAYSSASVGRGTLRFRNLDWLGQYIRERARPLGLVD